LFATESVAQALRQLEVYGHDGLPVLSADGHQIPGWVTAPDVLAAIARQITTPQAQTAQPQVAAHGGHDGPGTRPPTPLPGYQFTEVTVTAGSPAAGRKLADVTWPAGSTPVSVLHDRRLRPPHPGLTLAPGDRVGLLTAAPGGSPECHPAGHSTIRLVSDRSSNHG
jgi:chloride channel protein, CIC family